MLHQKMLLCFCVLILIVVGCKFGEKEQLRFDGIYQASSKDGERFFRFYEDKTVLTVGTIPGVKAAKIVEWFNKDNKKNVPAGVYSLNNGKIKFSATGEMGTVSFSGDVLKDKLIVKWVSQINNKTGTHEAEFIPLD